MPFSSSKRAFSSTRPHCFAALDGFEQRLVLMSDYAPRGKAIISIASDVWIVRRLVQHINHWLERPIRMMQQPVLRADYREDAFFCVI